jgi:hypothetical protein
MSVKDRGNGGRGGGAGQLSSQSTQLHAGDLAWKVIENILQMH